MLTKIHGGGATDENFLKNKKGKARSKQFGKVEIPQRLSLGLEDQ